MTDGTMSDLSSPPFSFPDYHSFPPFFTIQPNAHTRLSQLKKWSSLIQAYCRHHRIYRLSIPAAVESPLFRNAALRKRLSTTDVRVVIDWMVSGDGEKRAEWIDISSKTNAFIWWRTPEEWAGIIEDWVEATGQKNTVLTLYELIEGEDTMATEFHGIDQTILLKALQKLVKHGKAQVFGSEDQQGVKFF